MLGALFTFVFISAMAWQFVVLVSELRANNDTTMTAEILTWPWWVVTTAIVLFCVPIQAIVMYGHFRRAIEGGGPGGTVDPGGHGSEGGGS